MNFTGMPKKMRAAWRASRWLPGFQRQGPGKVFDASLVVPPGRKSALLGGDGLGHLMLCLLGAGHRDFLARLLVESARAALSRGIRGCKPCRLRPARTSSPVPTQTRVQLGVVRWTSMCLAPHMASPTSPVKVCCLAAKAGRNGTESPSTIRLNRTKPSFSNGCIHH